MYDPSASPSTSATARVTVDLDAMAANWRTIRDLTGAEAAAVVKADAYGLGAARAADRLWAEGARRFFVARISEGQALRRSLGDRAAVIYVLDGCPPGQAGALLDADLTPVLNSLAQVSAYAAFAAGADRPLKAALHVDTGMNRLGLRVEETRALAQETARLAKLEVEMVMSHLACADEPGHPLNRRQRDAFADVCGLFPNALKSFANSGGCFLGRDYAFDLVRPGIGVYGGGPEGRPDARIAPVATLDAEVVQVRVVPPGETVGYSCGWTATETTRVAILGVGYADGVLRSNSPHGRVWLNGTECRILGRVSMDLTAVDVSACDTVAPGDRAELFGRRIAIDTAAERAGTIAYELLTRLAPRLERRWV